MKLIVQYPGCTEVEVYKGSNKEPHFIIEGADINSLDKKKIRAHLTECDWTDKGSKGYILPRYKCDDFLKDLPA